MHEVVRFQRNGTTSRGEREQLAECQRHSLLGDPNSVCEAIVSRVAARCRLSSAMHGAVRTAVEAMVRDEAALLLGSGDGLPVEALLDFFEHERERVEKFSDLLVSMLSSVLTVVPVDNTNEQAVLTIEVPLIALIKNPGERLTGMVEACLSRGFDERSGVVQFGCALAERVTQRLCRASSLTEKAARENPYRLKWPKSSGLSSTELVATYLGGTALEALLLEIGRAHV